MTGTRNNIQSDESKEIDPANLCDALSNSANQVISYFESKLQKDGSYGADAKDLACYYKSPMMFLSAGKSQLALLILNHIKNTFMTLEGDFKTSSTLKSSNQAYIEYWSYTNGWIIRAANQLNMYEISKPAYQYFSQYFLGEKSGFLTNQVHSGETSSDVLTVAHHGLVNLENNNINLANFAGNYLCKAIEKQPKLEKGFYLRLDHDSNLITQFPSGKSLFFFVSTKETNQLHFMIGYPAAYLAMLYKETKNTVYLDAAKKYLDFSLSCDKSIYECEFSHKIAWAASLLYECTGDQKYLSVINKITDFFISNQKNGTWFSDDINKSYDQSAEIACWFLDIVKNINGFKKKIILTESKDSEPRPKKSFMRQALKYSTIALFAGAGLYALYKSKHNPTPISDGALNISSVLSNKR